MINRWIEVQDSYNIVAMLDNYTCYFGDGNNYPPQLVQKTVTINASSEVIANTKKLSVEDVKTGIIPKGYNGRIIRGDSVGGRIVYSDMYEQYKVHRISFVEYKDIAFTNDVQERSNTDDLIIYNSLDDFENALRSRAKQEVNSSASRYPTRTRTVKIADLNKYEHIVSDDIKINDFIVLIDDKNVGDRAKFTINKLTYNIVDESYEDIELVERS